MYRKVATWSYILHVFSIILDPFNQDEGAVLNIPAL